MKEFIACIPVNVDIDEILEQHPPKEKLKRDKLLYIFHILNTIPLNNWNNFLYGEWVLVSSTILKSVINDYKKYLDYLTKDVGIIICDEVFAPAGRCKGYKLSTGNHMLISNKFITITDKTLLKGIKRAWDKDHHGTSYVKNNLPYLHKWFNNKLTLEFPEDTDLDYNSYRTAKSIKNQRYRLSVDKFGKRLHTPLTRLNKDNRKYLRYDGKPLVELDISCCQPYMSIKLVLDNLSKKYPDIIEVLNTDTDNQTKIDTLSGIIEEPDVILFLEDVLVNDFYTIIQNGFKAKYEHPIGFDNREDYKSVMFEVMYSKSGYSSKAKALFKERYPTIDKIYNKIKYPDHKKFSKKLQQLESKLMLRTICKEIHQHDKTIPMFTIHDSILTTPEHKITVEKIMLDNLSKTIGFIPRIGFTDYIK